MVSADLLAVATEQEGSVVSSAIALGKIAANDGYIRCRAAAAQAFEHPIHRLRQHFFGQCLVRPHPVQQTRRILGQDQGVALRFAGAVHDPFKFDEGPIHGGERLVRLEAEVDDTARGLRRSDSNRVGGRRAGFTQGSHSMG